MWVIVLEALAALALLLFIVWWTMFSGRRRGEAEPHNHDP
jgi:cbb3-type cytochrome oxidase subunit 3